MDRFEHPDEHVLGEVLGVVAIAGEPVGEAVDLRRMVPDEFRPGGRTPVRIARSRLVAEHASPLHGNNLAPHPVRNLCVKRSTPLYDNVIGQFDGAFVVKVSEKGFDTKGKITHYTEKQIADMEDNYYYDYNKKIQRCVQIGDNLYTLSQGMVKVNNINTSDKLISSARSCATSHR